MQIKEARFIKSSQKTKDCPKPDKPEYAFIGRSNVGKSSLINMLTGRKKLAKISGTPGKTQLINHFLINNEWYLVDLPGYGYAKVSKSQRHKFGKLIEEYIFTRENLMCLFVLIDSRIPLQKSDLEFMLALGRKSIPFCIVFTKTDKLKKTTYDKHISSISDKLLEYWEELPPVFHTSSVSGKGRDEILSFIENINKKW
ncbi:MAG: YihA family ribosome biogenesis GTP-binding protein [Chlorobi bacterium]|nr:YihA family ribosome biogenesis GTP-binding protein [Chlorobiota bacterium]